MKTSDLISAAGVILILLAFVLSTFGWLSNRSRAYFLLNLCGGVFAFWGCLLIDSIPFAILEGTWALVAAAGLVRSLKSRPEGE